MSIPKQLNCLIISNIALILPDCIMQLPHYQGYRCNVTRLQYQTTSLSGIYINVS